MTLILAVLCRQNDAEKVPSTAIVVSDQLISEGGTDEQHEPPQLKAVVLKPHITAFLADNLDTGQRVCRELLRSREWAVVNAVDEAVKRLAAQVQETIRADFDAKLRRYHATVTTLLDGTAPLSASLRKRLLRAFQMATLDAAFLVVGADHGGAHIWVVSGSGDISCQDPWSFSAIGSGADLARQTLKRVGYQWSWMAGDALAVAFMAKRNAEMNAWVGDKRTSVVALTRERAYEAKMAAHGALKAMYTEYDRSLTLALTVAKSAGQQAADILFAPRPSMPLTPPDTPAPERPTGSSGDP